MEENKYARYICRDGFERKDAVGQLELYREMAVIPPLSCTSTKIQTIEQPLIGKKIFKLVAIETIGIYKEQ